MYRHDYIMRLIEQFGRVLASLLEKIRTRSAPAADVRVELAEIARQAGFDIDVARRLDSQMLLMWLAPTGEVDEARFWLIGELLFLDALQAREEGAGVVARAGFERATAVLSKLPSDWRPRPDLTSAGERVAEMAHLRNEI